MAAPIKKMTSNANRNAGATFGAGYVKGLLDFAVLKGADRADLLKAAQLAERDLADLDNRIALPRYVALLEAAISRIGEPALSLQYGEAVRIQDVSVVGLMCAACETMAEVGIQLNRYGRLMYDPQHGEEPATVGLVHRDDGLWMELKSKTPIHPFIAESEFARLVENARTMLVSNAYFQSTPFPLAMHFMHDEPSYRAEYERIFKSPVVFGSPWNAMKFDAGFLSLPLPPVNGYVFGLVSAHAEALLEKLQAAKTARGQAESLLLPILHKGDVSMDTIAGKMGLGRQTLLRRLKAEGTTFETLLDELRHRMALDYLRANKVSINEIAYLVGFSDSTAFSRALKRWTGVSPRALRREFGKLSR